MTTISATSSSKATTAMEIHTVEIPVEGKL